MIKWTSFDTQNSSGTYIQFFNDSLVKTAEYSPELKSRLNGLEKKANCTYVLVNAMGSGEFWGSNRNGDYFPEESLSRDHKTFEKLGHAYKHHVNKDPEKSLGKVKIAVFNPDMHRVELVIEVDNDRAKDILGRIEQGEYPAVSMGVKVPYDVCSVCGKKSKRTSDYCEHLKHQMGTVQPGGLKVYAINDTDLKFFDISFVRIPADRTAGVLAKIAGVEVLKPSAVVAEEVLKAAGIKESAINKIIDGTVSAVDNDPKRLIYASQQDIPREELKEILSKYAMADILSTFMGLRIVPKPMDFQYMILEKAGQVKLAEQAEQAGKVLMDMDEDPEYPADISLDNFNDELAAKIAHWVPGMTLTAPHVIRRVLEKRAELSVSNQQHPVAITINPGVHTPALNAPKESTFSSTKNPLIGILGLGALYIGYNSLIDSMGMGKSIAEQGKFEQFLLSKPWLIPIVLGAAAAGTVGAQDMMFQKSAGAFQPNFLKRTLVAVPASYIYAGSQENKLQQGQPITEFGDFVRKHPFMTSVVGIVGAGQMQKLFKKGPIGPGIPKTAEYVPDVIDRLVNGLTTEKFEQFYNDVIDA